MDPNACWQRIRNALLAKDTLEAIDGAIDLAGWLNGGGFYPDVDRLTLNVTPRDYVWSVLDFLLGLDPDDSFRDSENPDDTNHHHN
jgi:hypothetical protein